jgi:hypothetical protein
MLGNKLGLEDPATSQSTLTRARALLAYDSDSTDYLETRSLIDALALSFAPQLSESAVMREYELKLRDRYISLDIQGAFAGFMYALTRTARAADPKRAISRALREAVPQRAGNIEEFVNFIFSVVISFDGGRVWIDSAASQLREETETMLDRASAAGSFGEFYGRIFESIPLAYGAKRAYLFLAGATEGDRAAEYKRAANICDERFAAANGALNIDFANSMDWRYLLAHRRQIESERRRNGEWAAQRVADEYIKLSMLYPPFVAPFLLGQTATLTLSKAPLKRG